MANRATTPDIISILVVLGNFLNHLITAGSSPPQWAICRFAQYSTVWPTAQKRGGPAPAGPPLPTGKTYFFSANVHCMQATASWMFSCRCNLMHSQQWPWFLQSAVQGQVSLLALVEQDMGHTPFLK